MVGMLRRRLDCTLPSSMRAGRLSASPGLRIGAGSRRATASTASSSFTSVTGLDPRIQTVPCRQRPSGGVATRASCREIVGQRFVHACRDQHDEPRASPTGMASQDMYHHGGDATRPHRGENQERMEDSIDADVVPPSL